MDDQDTTPQEQGFSQEEPTQDSGLQTPQPDQPVPTEQERHEQAQQEQAAQEQAAEEQAQADYNESHQEQPLSGDEDGAKDSSPSEPVEQTVPQGTRLSGEEQQAQREQAVRDHNARSGGGEVAEGSVQAARDEHNERTGDASQQ